MQRWRHGGLYLAQNGETLLIDHRHWTLVGHLGVAQRMDRAFHAIGEWRGVEVSKHRPAIVAGTPNHSFAADHIDEEALDGFWNLLERQAPAPRAQLRARPVDLGRRQVAGIELMHQQHVEVFLLGRPRLRR